MKHIITLSAIVVFAMIAPQVVAQSGGLNVKNVSASEKITVGSESDTEITDMYMTFASLTEYQINSLTPKKGMIVYNEATNYFQYWNGTEWTSFVIPADLPPIPCEGVHTDIDGNYFNGVQIGNQCWMDRNLEVTHYPNGDAIPYVTNDSEWAALADNNTDDAYCYYAYNTSSEYGALYTYAAAIADNWQRDNADGQGICPDGWHLPTDAEWKVLEGTVDTQYPVGDSVWNDVGHRGYDAGTHLKSTTTGWIDNGNGDNSSGFTALPGGIRSNYNGAFGSAGYGGYWWSAPEDGSDNAWNRLLYYRNANVTRNNFDKSIGFSVRCLRDY